MFGVATTRVAVAALVTALGWACSDASDPASLFTSATTDLVQVGGEGRIVKISF